MSCTRSSALIDDPRNDIYLHIDRRAKNFDHEAIATAVEKSRLFLAPRINVYWGHYTQITAILNMLGEAVANTYSYYHLLSGADLPLKNQDYIHSFFEENSDYEFVGFSETYNREWVGKIYPLSQYCGSRNRYARKASQLAGRGALRLQELVHYDHTTWGSRRGLAIRKGSDWSSISHAFAIHLLSERQVIAGLLRYATIPTEFYCQTILWNSTFRERIYDTEDEFRSSMRLIDWERGGPYIFRDSDFDELMGSDRLFARKFDASVDAEVVNRIYEAVLGR